MKEFLKSKSSLNMLIISGLIVLAVFLVGKENLYKSAANLTEPSIVTGPAQDVTSSLVDLGKPVKKSRAYANNIWDMQVMNNKIYLGHGDWNANAGPIPIISYNPLTNAFVTEDTAYDEQIWRLNMIDGELWIPGTDANNANYYHNTTVGWNSGSWSWGNLYRLVDGGWKIYRNTPGGVHVLDVIKYNGRLYATQGVSGTYNQIVVSNNDGDTWTSATPNTTVCTGINTRCWQIFELNGKLYSAGGFMNTSTNANNNNTTLVAFEPDGSYTRSTIRTASFLPGIGSGTTKSKYVMDHQVKYGDKLLFIVNAPIPTNNNSGTNGDTDNMFNPVAMYIASSISSSTKLAFPNNAVPSDFIVRDDGVYVLTRVDNGDSGFTNIVYKASSLTMTSTASVWTELFEFRTAAGVFARSFEEMDRDFYFGMGGPFMESASAEIGKIYKIPSSAWAPKAKIDGITLPTGTIQPSAKITITAIVSNVTNCSLDHGIGNVTITGSLTDGIYKNGTISLSNVTAYSSYKLTCENKTYNDVVTKKAYLTVNQKSNVADLKSLSVTEGVLSPSFDPDVTNYTLMTKDMFTLMPSSLNSLTISQQVADSTSSVAISGNSLKAGKNTVLIKVTAADGTIKTYNIQAKKAPGATYTVHRTKSGEADIKLDLVTDNTGLSPQVYALSPVGGGNYRIQIAPNDAGVTVKAVTPESSTAGVTITNNTITGTMPVNGSWKMFTIILTTADGVESQQRIAIHGLSNVATLSALSVVKSTGPTVNYTLTPDFASATYEYEITEQLLSTVMNLTVNATASSRGTRVITGNTNLAGGKRVIEIVVTSEDKSVTRTYKVTVTKPADDITLTTSYKHNATQIFLGDEETLTKFLSNIQTNGTTKKVYRSNKTTEVTSGTIGTGMVLRITLGSLTKDYTLIVKGDANGDGSSDSVDLLLMIRHIVGIESLTGVYYTAGDVDDDNDLSSIDLLKLKRYILGIGEL